MTGEEIEALTALSRSRTEPAGRSSLGSDAARLSGEAIVLCRGTKTWRASSGGTRCVVSERWPMARLRHLMTDRDRAPSRRSRRRPRPGWYLWPATRPRSTAIRMNCWTTRLTARHARERGPAAGHHRLARLAQGTVCKLLGQEEIKPHKVSLLSSNAATPSSSPRWRKFCACLPRGPGPEKSRCQGGEIEEASRDRSLTTRSLESRPSPRRHRICRQCQASHASFARDHEYKRHGARSACWPGSICSPAKGSTRSSRERHRSREFIEFLKLLDAAYPASISAIKLILDNHSAHISRETRAWLSTPGRQAASTLPSRPSTAPGSPTLIEGFFF